LEKSRESRLRTEIRDLKRLLVEKTLEADFWSTKAGTATDG